MPIGSGWAGLRPNSAEPQSPQNYFSPPPSGFQLRSLSVSSVGERLETTVAHTRMLGPAVIRQLLVTRRIRGAKAAAPGRNRSGRDGDIAAVSPGPVLVLDTVVLLPVRVMAGANHIGLGYVAIGLTIPSKEQ